MFMSGSRDNDVEILRYYLVLLMPPELCRDPDIIMSGSRDKYVVCVWP